MIQFKKGEAHDYGRKGFEQLFLLYDVIYALYYMTSIMLYYGDVLTFLITTKVMTSYMDDP